MAELQINVVDMEAEHIDYAKGKILETFTTYKEERKIADVLKSAFDK
jgi:hypothetical protein